MFDGCRTWIGETSWVEAFVADRYSLHPFIRITYIVSSTEVDMFGVHFFEGPRWSFLRMLDTCLCQEALVGIILQYKFTHIQSLCHLDKY